MAIDALSEELLTFGQAARRARPNGSRPAAPSTIWRWHSKGIAGVRLETVCMGGTRYTSAEALQRFFDAVTAVRDAERSAAVVDPDIALRSAATSRRLQEAGLT